MTAWTLKAARERDHRALAERMRPYLQHQPICDAINRHLDVPKRICDCGLDALLRDIDGGGGR